MSPRTCWAWLALAFGPLAAAAQPGTATDRPSTVAKGTAPATGGAPSTVAPAAAAGCTSPPSSGHANVHVFPSPVCVFVTRPAATARFETTAWPVPDKPAPKGAAPRDRASKEPVPLTLRVLGLVNAANGERIHPQAPTTVVLPPLAVSGGKGPVTWALNLPLVDPPSGRYAGYLFAEWKTRNEEPVLIPIMLHVRDDWIAAFLILAIGAAISLLLRAYRAFGLGRDESYARVARAEALVLSDEALDKAGKIGEPFRQKFTEHLVAALSALDVRLLSMAPTDLDAAEKLWIKWQKSRDVWIAGLGAAHALAETVSSDPSPHARRLAKMVSDHYQNAPKATDASEYRQAVEQKARQVDLYRTFIDEVQQALDAANRIADDSKTAARTELAAVLSEWTSFEPGNDPQTSQNRADTLRKELASISKKHALPSSDAAERKLQATAVEARDTDDFDNHLVPRKFRQRMRTALASRRWYAGITALLVYAGIVFVGFDRTYNANPIFGADRLRDWLQVAAWALGADLASRATLLGLGGTWPASGRNASGADPAGGFATPGPAPLGPAPVDRPVGSSRELAAVAAKRPRFPI